MAGSIRVTPAGTLQLRVSAGRDPMTGRRRELVETMPKGTSKRAASLRLAELVSKAQRGTHSSNAVTVRQVIDAWDELPRLSKATRAKTAAAVKHIPAAIASMRADRLTGRELDQLYRHLEAKSVGAATIRNVHGTIGAAYGQANKWGWLERNPTRQATPPPEPPLKTTAPTQDQVDALLAATIGEQRQLWLRLHLVTGARAGEVLALRWSSLDLDHSKIRITESIQRDLARTPKAPKTRKGIRVVTVDDETVRRIRGWQLIQRTRALETGAGLARDPYLLSHDDDSSRPWRPHSAGQLFVRIARRAGVTGISVHDLRHHAASVLLAAGVDVLTVASRLGFDPRTLLRVYAHVIEGRDRQAAEIIARTAGG